MEQRAKIIQAFIEFELLEGRAPHSPLELTKKIKLKESEFYEHFSGLDKLRSVILNDIVMKTLVTLDADEMYSDYSAREKLLALYFTLFEKFLEQRSYFVNRYSHIRNLPDTSPDWKLFLESLTTRVQEILNEAKSEQEIEDRPLIGNHYAKGYKLLFAYLFRVWLKDDTEGFTTTDAAIEKSVNLSFELLGKSPLDSLLDFGKFAFTTKVI